MTEMVSLVFTRCCVFSECAEFMFFTSGVPDHLDLDDDGDGIPDDQEDSDGDGERGSG